MHYAGQRHLKGKLKMKIRCSVGQKTIAMSSFASGCWCIVNFVSANHLIPHRIASLNLKDESDIDWKSLGYPSWDMWSAHFLQQKWRQLKTSYNADGAHHGQCMTLSFSVFQLHVFDRCRTSPHNPGFCDKTSVYAPWRHTHTPVTPSTFYLLQCLKGFLGMQ